jgi:hypothetical protein
VLPSPRVAGVPHGTRPLICPAAATGAIGAIGAGPPAAIAVAIASCIGRSRDNVSAKAVFKGAGIVAGSSIATVKFLSSFVELGSVNAREMVCAISCGVGADISICYFMLCVNYVIYIYII